jgi:hypothetical protein
LNLLAVLRDNGAVSFLQYRAAALVFIGMLCACGGQSSSGYHPGDANLAATNPGGGPIDPFLTDGSNVRRALDAIAERSGRPLRVTSLNADNLNGLTVEVQEPSHHANVDQYVVAPDGSIAGPTAVQVHSFDGGPITAALVDARAFDPNMIAFENLARAAKDAIGRSGQSDTRVFQWEIDGTGPDDRRFIYLQSSRARPSAQIDNRLRIVRMQF